MSKKRNNHTGAVIDFDAAFEPVTLETLRIFGEEHVIERGTTGYSQRMARLGYRLLDKRKALLDLRAQVQAIEAGLGGKRVAGLQADPGHAALLNESQRSQWQRRNELQDELQMLGAEADIEANLGHVLAMVPTLEPYRERLERLPLAQMRWLLEQIGIAGEEEEGEAEAAESLDLDDAEAVNEALAEAEGN